MKHFISHTILAIGLLLPISCSRKSESIPINKPPGNQVQILGKWSWQKSTTGWGGESYPPQDTSIAIKLNDDSTFSVWLNSDSVLHGAFSTVIIPAYDSLPIIQFNTIVSVSLLHLRQLEHITYVNNDTCWLYDYLTSDGSSHLFTRIK